MFSFHKPRVYRSTEGCCICRAKSSSSRFTDSRKYETDSMKCFDLKYPRHGEICNACVLLVKRYKRLPVGSTRHWGHVVDARAGPGTKSMSKHKKNRDDSGDQCSTSNGNNNNSVSGSNNSSANGSHASRRTQNSKSLIPEKFSKIFKKSKKNKSNGTTATIAAAATATCSKREVGVKRRSTGTSATAQSWDQHSLPTTPDSLDSDYEDGGRSTLSSSGAIVQFQTQTRASSYRSRNATAIGANNSNPSGGSNVGVQRKRLLQMGSKRRKVLPPRKYRRTNADEQSVGFFDEHEWQERKSCCGMVYECEQLAGALLLDLAYYRPCVEHGPIKAQEQQASQTQQSIVTLPAMTELSPPTTSPVAVASTPPPVVVFSANPTPALKKHHLFFKRQSECFPHGDLNMHNTEFKTESTAPAITSNNNNGTTTTNATVESAIAQPGGATVACSSSAASLLSINTAHISATAQMPRHSTAKITTISPPITVNSNNNNSSNGNSACNKLIHKIKAGKIFKNSLEKINAGVVDRVKCMNEGPELKNMVRAVHKSYVLAKPNNSTIVNSSGNTTSNGLPNNPTCTTSSAPKFSDNSSDSGFDENMQDRKSASPLQEDTERKLATRNPMGNVHTMFLANGIQIHGQPQNLLLAGTEAAARMLQKRNQTITTNKAMGNLLQNGAGQYQTQQSNTRLNVSGAAVKIVGAAHGNNAPSSTTTGAAVTIGGASLLGSHAKPSATVAAAARAIYNNNTIQHENGVTTILPASSLAASTQTAAMNALAPSTVTITPAPTHHLGNSINKKLQVTSNGNNQSNNIIHNVVAGATHITSNNNSKNNNSNHHLAAHHTSTALNQKIILLKTAPSVTKYNNNASASSAKATVAGVSAINNGAVVPSITLSNLNTSACKN